MRRSPVSNTPPIVEGYRRARLAAPTRPARGDVRLPSWLYAMGAVSAKQADKKAWIAFWAIFIAAPIWVGFGPMTIDGAHTIAHVPVPAAVQLPFTFDLPIVLASVVVALWVYFQYLCGPLLNWALPPFRQGSRFFSERLAAAPDDLQFRYGAVPVALIVIPLAVLAVCTAHTDAHMTGVVAYFTILLAGVTFSDLVESLDGKRVPWANMLRKRPHINEETPVPTPGPFELYIGRGTGRLSARGHVCGIDRDERIKLQRDDILRSFAVIGDTGSGKTAAGIRPLLVQLLDHGCGLVVCDGKNDIGPEVIGLAQCLDDRKVYRIGIGGYGVNLFDGLSPDQVADILAQSLKLTNGGSQEGFWESQAVGRCKNALGILHEVDPENYNLAGLRQYVFNDERSAEIIEKARKSLDKLLDAHEEAYNLAQRLNACIMYEPTEWPTTGKVPETLRDLLSTREDLAKFAERKPYEIEGILEAALALVKIESSEAKEYNPPFHEQALILAKYALALVYALDAKNYGSAAVLRCLSDTDYRKKLIAQAPVTRDALLEEHGPGMQCARRLKGYLEYEICEWPKVSLAPETLGSIYAHIQNIFHGFDDPQLIDTFCSPMVAQARFHELDHGALFVVDLSLAKYGTAAQTVYLFIKEAVFRHVKARSELSEADKRNARPIGIICDEYQKITSGTTDLNAIDTMRSLGGFMAVCFQSINALNAAIHDEATVKALLANLTQKIIFASGDPDTIGYAESVLGSAEQFKTTYSTSDGKDSTKGRSGSNNLYSVVNAQTFRSLHQPGKDAHAVALLRIGGSAYDDIILCGKVYSQDLPKPIVLPKPRPSGKAPSIITGSEQFSLAESSEPLSLSGGLPHNEGPKPSTEAT
jgi:TraM recognition site of TraD and TraG